MGTVLPVQQNLFDSYLVWYVSPPYHRGGDFLLQYPTSTCYDFNKGVFPLLSSFDKHLVCHQVLF